MITSNSKRSLWLKEVYAMYHAEKDLYLGMCNGDIVWRNIASTLLMLSLHDLIMIKGGDYYMQYKDYIVDDVGFHDMLFVPVILDAFDSLKYDNINSFKLVDYV